MVECSPSVVEPARMMRAGSASRPMRAESKTGVIACSGVGLEDASGTGDGWRAPGMRRAPARG